LLPVTELTLKFVGCITADVYDSPLAQCLRAKAALLAPSLAAGRAADAAADATADRAAAYDARVAAFIRAARAAGVGAEGAGGGEAPRYAPAMRVSAGDMRVTLVFGGGPAPTYGVDKKSEAVVSAAEAVARAADAPWWGGVVNKHSTDIECSPFPAHGYMIILTQLKSCSDLGSSACGR
jgi:hypothetical protein